MPMKKSLLKLSTFGIIYFVVLAVAGYFLISTEKLPFHLLINQQHNQYADLFFKYFTHLGDGLFVVLFLCGVGFFIKFRDTLLGAIAFLISGIGSQLLKKIFSSEMRPVTFFEPNVLHFVDGVKINSSHSFPSGHTATAFAFFIFLSYIYNRNINQFFFVIAACLIAFSRVYLSQHFVFDVIFGSILGVLSFIVALRIVNSLDYKRLDSKFDIKRLFTKKAVATDTQ